MRYQVPFLKSLVWRDLELNPGLPDHWQTLWNIYIYGGKYCTSRMRYTVNFLKMSLTGLNSKFPSSGCHIMVKQPSPPNYLSIAGEGIVALIPLSRVKCKQPHPGFELGLPSPFPTTVTIVRWTLGEKDLAHYFYFFVWSIFIVWMPVSVKNIPFWEVGYVCGRVVVVWLALCRRLAVYVCGRLFCGWLGGREWFVDFVCMCLGVW